MFKKYGYDIPSILYAVANGIELSSGQKEAAQEWLEKYEERLTKQALERKAAHESFKQEIMDILEENPGVGFTPTSIQFSIHNFINRHITNQKVAYYLKQLVIDGKINRCFKGKKVLFYYGNLVAYHV